MTRSGLACLFCLLLGLSTSAQAVLIFEFEFADAGGSEVTGRIFGLVDDTANQAATSILIDSFTGQTPGVFDPSSNDPVTWSAQFNNAFDVSAGQITAATFAAQDATIRATFCLDRGGCLTETNVLRLQIPDVRISNSDGFAGVTFRNITPVPEPGLISLILLGLLLPAWMQTRAPRQRRAARI